MASSPGKKREVPGSHCLGNPTQSKIIKSYWLFLALSRGCWELSMEDTVLSRLEGELCVDAFPYHGHEPSCPGSHRELAPPHASVFL